MYFCWMKKYPVPKMETTLLTGAYIKEEKNTRKFKFVPNQT